jgi:hypothetical protein
MKIDFNVEKESIVSAVEHLIMIGKKPTVKNVKTEILRDLNTHPDPENPKKT